MKEKNNSFSRKLLRSCLAFTLIPILVFLLVYFCIFIRMSRKNLQAEFDTEVKMLTTQVDELFSNMSFISLELLNRSDFFSSIKQLYYNSPDLQSVTEQQKKVVRTMLNYAYFQDTFEIIYLDANGYYYNTATDGSYYPMQQITQEEFSALTWLDDVDNAAGAAVLLDLGDSRLQNGDGPMLSLARSISAPTMRIGFLIVQVPVEKRDYLFTPFQENGAEFCLYSEDGTALYHSEGFPQIEGREALELQNKNGKHYVTQDAQRYMISTWKADETGIFTVALYPSYLLMRSVLSQMTSALTVAVLLLVMTAIWIVLFSQEFSQPLLNLTEMIRGTTLDNLKQQPQIDLHDASDEVRYLHTSYLEMNERLNTMVHEKMELLTLQAEQRYRFLQYQINPHFMYNTLNVIGIMGMEGGQIQVYQSCQMLAKLLRYSLRDYRKGTTFREEIDNIHTYLELMKIRFEHKFSYTVNYNEELNPYQIPRFTLQPFVENIFEHAFGPEHKTVHVQIRACVDPDQWHIIISDNGCGISQEAIERLHSSIDRYFANEDDFNRISDVYDGIGMKNTIARLHVFFHGQFSYEISNNESGGCLISLRGALIEGDEK